MGQSEEFDRMLARPAQRLTKAYGPDDEIDEVWTVRAGAPIYFHEGEIGMKILMVVVP